MKVVLSRKGFDSGFGGYASFILPDGTIQSLPIPSSGDSITYCNVKSRYQDFNLMELMQNIKPQIKEYKWKPLNSETHCHLDPDIDYYAMARDSKWRGCFGQIGAAQTVLENSHIGVGDLFLFFGWFNDCELYNNSLKMKKGNGRHVLFGYLQIGEIIHTATDKIPAWLKYHPHSQGERVNNKNNCIYVARESSSWNENIPGYGVFKYNAELDLSMPGMSRSKWKLPEIFRGLSITYHTQNSWKDGYFQSAARGQEFVVEENDAISKWAQNLINNNVSKNEESFKN